MAPDPHQVEQLLEAYMAGELSAADRALVEQMLQQDPQLGMQLQLDRQFEQALRRQYAPPAPPPLPPVATPVGVAVRIVLALLALSAVAGAVYVAIRPVPRPTIIEASGQVYQETTQYRGEHFIHSNAHDLESHLAQKLGVALTMPRGDGIRFAGFVHSTAGSPRALDVSAIVQGHAVTLHLDRTSQPVVEGTSAVWPGLWRHVKRINDLVLVELSPFPAPRVLPGIHSRS